MKEMPETVGKIRRITWLGFWVNTGLATVKLILGILGNSQAVVADALHSFSDTSSDVVILFGVKYWTAPPDEDHPFGHRKIESLVTGLIGILLIAVALRIGYDAGVSLMNPVAAKEPAAMVVIAPLLSILVKEALFRLTYRVGVETRSSSVKANAWHHRTDALSSVPVLVAVGGCLVSSKLAFLDPVGAILVSVFIIKVGGQILCAALKELLDTSMSTRELDRIRDRVRSTPNVLGVHKIRSRNLGDSFYVDLHLEVDGNLTVREGHEISEQVKDILLEKNHRIIDVMVHLEPAGE